MATKPHHKGDILEKPEIRDAAEIWNQDQTPVFIYPPPFLCKSNYPKPFIDSVTPLNIPLQGIFRQSFAYDSMRERMPVILTKVIDSLSRNDGSTGAKKGELKQAIQDVSELRNEVMTNKTMRFLKDDSEEADKWTRWITNQRDPKYFTADWVFAECYTYRRIQEALEHYPSLKNVDPFQTQKHEAFHSQNMAMCMVADKVTELSDASTVPNEMKKELSLLMKIMLWANRCDLSLTNGEAAELVTDPVRYVDRAKDKVIIDESKKIAGTILKRGKTVTAKTTKEEPVVVAPVGKKGKPPKPKKFDMKTLTSTCPASMKGPDKSFLDIICDNAGYELFTDLCFAHYLIKREVVQCVRFHLKKMPWFVSDTTPEDFKWVIDQCKSVSYNQEVALEPDPPKKAKKGKKNSPVEELPPPEPIIVNVNSGNLQKLGEAFQEHLDKGQFEIHADEFWTYPLTYNKMKKDDEYMYRKLQFAVLLVFKGDLNYRKLVGDKNWYSPTKFQAAMEGFNPAPIAAIRTVKSDLISGLPVKKADKLNETDKDWMRKGEYGQIQFCKKKDKMMKITVKKPCPTFGTPECTGGPSCVPVPPAEGAEGQPPPA